MDTIMGFWLSCFKLFSFLTLKDLHFSLIFNAAWYRLFKPRHPIFCFSEVNRCPQLSEIYSLRKHSIIIVNRLVYWTFAIIVNI